MTKTAAIFLVAICTTVGGQLAQATEFHVSTNGNDASPGTADQPLKTISTAAKRAQPGDTVTVHAGTYREQINPPRGGQSDQARIVYQAANSEQVIIKGSEVIKGWKKLQNDTWKVTVPNTLFGDFNPYSDLIHGDWFGAKGRQHHTGSVYLNNHWLTEAAQLDHVLQPIGAVQPRRGGYLLNVAWIKTLPDKPEATSTHAASFTEQSGIGTANCSEGGQCIGWIENGDWTKYQAVDFGDNTDQLEIRAASLNSGGLIEIRLDSPTGRLLGTCDVQNTGGWQSWSSLIARIEPTKGKKTICLVFKDTNFTESDQPLWFAQADDKQTTIWAQFKDVDPNKEQVEINVRQSIFYPRKTNTNYITVRGFTMMHAATPWSPPTAEQIGLIGTNWSRGWIIEDNDISYSVCAGITLGKYGDQWDNTSQNSAEGYVKTIHRALENGWAKQNVGHHVVRNNRISHCEQAGIVGSLGAIFCTITGNDIHHIHTRQLFTGAEMSAIKLHAAIDTVISNNHVHHSNRGIWLDWMAQGTRVTNNLCHHNSPHEDLFLEVNHGPFMIDNNIFLSPTALLDMSQGGAFAHNLFAGRIVTAAELGRETPYHTAHSTKLAGFHNIQGGDVRFYNNIFAGFTGLTPYNSAILPTQTKGNVYLSGATPTTNEKDALYLPDCDPKITLLQEPDGLHLQASLDPAWTKSCQRSIVTTALLGKAKITGLPYEHPDTTPYTLDRDWYNKKRNPNHPSPGPFELTTKTSNHPLWPHTPTRPSP